MPRLVQDRDRIAEGMNDLVVHRLFSAGLALETALGLMGGHPGAGKVQEAIGELDLAIRDVRNVVFDHHQPDPLPGRAAGLGHFGRCPARGGPVMPVPCTAPAGSGRRARTSATRASRDRTVASATL